MAGAVRTAFVIVSVTGWSLNLYDDPLVGPAATGDVKLTDGASELLVQAEPVRTTAARRTAGHFNVFIVALQVSAEPDSW